MDKLIIMFEDILFHKVYETLHDVKLKLGQLSPFKSLQERSIWYFSQATTSEYRKVSFLLCEVGWVYGLWLGGKRQECGTWCNYVIFLAQSVGLGGFAAHEGYDMEMGGGCS